MSDEQAIGWAVLELMGHRKLAGYLTDDKGLTRIDVYLEDPSEDPEDSGVKLIATQWYGSAAIYCITATTKENCTALTKSHQPAPIGRWELPKPVSAPDEEISDAEYEMAAEHGDDEWDER